MTRSKRKTPIFGNTTAESDKDFKTRENRRLRRTVPPDEVPSVKDFGNPCKSEKDGKSYWPDGSMRK